MIQTMYAHVNKRIKKFFKRSIETDTKMSKMTRQVANKNFKASVLLLHRYLNEKVSIENREVEYIKKNLYYQEKGKDFYSCYSYSMLT
jgi:hypothetical protein